MKLMIVDDEEVSRKGIFNFLKGQIGMDVEEFDNAPEALNAYKKEHFQIVITDLKMPGMDGFRLLKEIKKNPQGKFTDVILITGFGDIDTAIEALRSGAYDFLQKPINIEELYSIIKRSEEHLTLLIENREYREEFDNLFKNERKLLNEKCGSIQDTYIKIAGYGDIGIFSDHLKSIMEFSMQLYRDRSVPVLIEGDTGTGKEIIARLIHQGGTNNRGVPFIPINCAAIPETLFENELFGHEQGSFTDSKKSGAMGKFELAHEGTLFLDEIGDLPLEMQSKLLRVIEERNFYKLGGIKKVEIDVRLICATNRNLKKLVNENRFRRDLYFRLNTAQILLKPLSERREEIKPLANIFLQRFNSQKNKNFNTISEKASKILESHDWPGNIRELLNTIERVVLLNDDKIVKPEHLNFISSSGSSIRNETEDITLDRLKLPEEKFDLKKFEQNLVFRALRKFNGNKTKTAEYLNLTRSALRSKLK